MIDAARRASAGRITAVVPYYPYCRSDKKDQPRVPITARLIANFLETAGADRLLTVDLHAGQIQGFFNIPVDELTALSILANYFQAKRIPNLTVVATDVGGAKGARRMADRLDAPLAIVEKRRLGNDEKVEADDASSVRSTAAQSSSSTTRSSPAARSSPLRRSCIEHGATAVYAAATHPILAGDAVDRIEKAPIQELVFTDTIPIPPEKKLPNFTILSVAPLLGEAIQRIHTGQSVGALFNGH